MKIFKIENKGKASWGVDYRDPLTGKRKRRVIGQNKKGATKVLSKIDTEITEKGYFEDRKLINKSFTDVKDEYMTQEIRNIKKKYPQYDEYILNQFMEFTPLGKNKIKELNVPEVDIEVVEQYKAFRAGRVAHSTVDRELNVIRHFMRFAKSKRYIRDNPFPDVKLFREDLNRVVYFEPDEVERLLNACDSSDCQSKHLKPIVTISLNTGLRPITLLNLKWNDVDFVGRFIYTGTTKNGHKLTVHMNSDVREALENWKVVSVDNRDNWQNDYIFKSRSGKPFKHVRKSYYNAIRRAGLDSKGADFYSLRHTFCSQLAKSTKDLNLVKEAAGHKRLDMTLRYIHLAEDYKKDSIEGMYKKKGVRNPAEI